MRLGEVAARHPFDLDAAAQRARAAPCGWLCACARRAPQKISKLAIVFVPPMKLLVGALEKAELAGEAPFLLGEEGEVERETPDCSASVGAARSKKRSASRLGAVADERRVRSQA